MDTVCVDCSTSLEEKIILTDAVTKLNRISMDVKETTGIIVSFGSLK